MRGRDHANDKRSLVIRTLDDGRSSWARAVALVITFNPTVDCALTWLTFRGMAEKLASGEGRALHKLSRQTVEPVFGVIKAVLGFAGFSLRGLVKVEGE